MVTKLHQLYFVALFKTILPEDGRGLGLDVGEGEKDIQIS